MSTISKKLKTVFSFKYLITVGDLEHFLKLTKHLRLSLHFYIQITQSLQIFKNLMLKSIFIIGSQKKIHLLKTKYLPFILKEILLFTSFKKSLFTLNLLIHFDSTRSLWIDFNVFQKFGFGTIIFHIAKKHKPFKKQMACKNYDTTYFVFISNIEPFGVELFVYQTRNCWLCLGY